MADLLLRNRVVKSVFQLLGEYENDMSYSVAWGLAQSPNFLRELLSHLIQWTGDVDEVQIFIQEHRLGQGITDIEILLPGDFHIILEAKRGWNLPHTGQLQLYADRLIQQNLAPVKRLVAVSECSQQYAVNLLPPQLNGIPVLALSWQEINRFSKETNSKGSHAEKRLLAELSSYLEGVIQVQNKSSNIVYVVSLSDDMPAGWSISWIDIVQKLRLYFHPFDKHWPKEPVNYIAFRYYGKLQSIHHVESYKIVTNMNAEIPAIPPGGIWKHYLYSLGKPFKPAHEVLTGPKIHRAARVSCAMDTLFTCPTISDAMEVTRQRNL